MEVLIFWWRLLKVKSITMQVQVKVGLIKIDVNTWWQKGTGQGKGLLRKLLRECRREFKEVGWLPLHNKQLILSIPSRFDNRYTEAEAIQAAF